MTFHLNIRPVKISALHLKITRGAGGARLGTKNSIPSNLGKEQLKITLLYFVLLIHVRALYLLVLLYLLCVSCYAFFVYYVFVCSIRNILRLLLSLWFEFFYIGKFNTCLVLMYCRKVIYLLWFQRFVKYCFISS